MLPYIITIWGKLSDKRAIEMFHYSFQANSQANAALIAMSNFAIMGRDFLRMEVVLAG